MRKRTAVGDRRRIRKGLVCPAGVRSGAFECLLVPRLPRRLPNLVATAQRAGDLRLEMARYQVGMAIQAP